MLLKIFIMVRKFYWKELILEGSIFSAVLTLDNNFIISGSADGSIKMFNISKKEQEVSYFNDKIKGKLRIRGKVFNENRGNMRVSFEF